MELLSKVGETYNISFSDKEKQEFSLVNSFGVPVESIKAFLAIPSDRRAMKENALGIPCDSINNQFKQWVRFAREINGKDMTIAIKCDQSTPYPKIKNVINTLQDVRENRYNLITNLEQMPSGI